MSLVGIIAKNKDIQAIKKEVKNIDVIQITKESIKNFKNIKFDEIIFLQNINLEKEEHKYMNEIISNSWKQDPKERLKMDEIASIFCLSVDELKSCLRIE